MNKEQQELVNEAYKSYLKHNDEVDNYWIKKNPEIKSRWKPYSKEEFINKCKTDQEFSEKWGLKIEERELSLEERIIFAGYDYENRGGIGWNMLKESVDLDNSIPRKLITITYNNKTIENYE
jgi:hypothetical protein